jgi:Tol biopolymer transport system component
MSRSGLACTFGTCTVGTRLAIALLSICTAAHAADPGYPKASVIYATLAPHGSRIFIAVGDGGNPRPLAGTPGYDYSPSLSADGQWVVFTSEVGGSPDIYRVRADGSDVRQLADTAHNSGTPAWIQ